MKSIQVELPDKLAAGLNYLVTAGWFRSEEEGIRIAIMDYLKRCDTDLHERFLREDIAWALSQSKVHKS